MARAPISRHGKLPLRSNCGKTRAICRVAGKHAIQREFDDTKGEYHHNDTVLLQLQFNN